MDIQGVKTSTLEVTEISTFNSLPTSTQNVVNNDQLTTKIYVDNQDTLLNTRITDTDTTQKTYIDSADSTLNTRITNTDSDQRIYIDSADSTLNTRITTTDSDQRIYIDQQFLQKTGGRPSFYAYNKNTSQTLSNARRTQLIFNEIVYNYLEKYDVGNGSCYFQPIGYPGFYLVIASVTLDNITNLKLDMNKISYPNGPNGEGVNTLEGTESFSSETAKTVTLFLNIVVYLNGEEETTAIPSSDRVSVNVYTTQQQDIPINGGLRNKIFFTANYLHP
jgi:hypothetical protein